MFQLTHFFPIVDKQRFRLKQGKQLTVSRIRRAKKSLAEDQATPFA